MKKKFSFLLLCLLAISATGFSKSTSGSKPVLLTCDICVNGICNANPFNLTPGQTYTFYTTAVPGAHYYWTISGTGISIVGPRNQSTVQVSIGCDANGKICLVKSKDGEDPVCCCYDVVSPPCESCCIPYPDPYYHCEDGPVGSRGGILALGGGCPDGTFSSVTITLGYDATFLTAPYTGLQTITVNNPTNSYPWNTYLFQFNSCVNYPWPPDLPITFVYHYSNPNCPDRTVHIDVEPEYLMYKNSSGKKNNTQILFTPNPAKSVLKYTNPSHVEFKGIIYNLDGKEVKTFTSVNQEIDISNLVKGIYVIKLFGRKGEQIDVKKFIKE
jgi:hypothetical protein